MSSRSGQYAAETYRDEDDRRYDDDDAFAERADDRRSSYLPGLPWGGWPSLGWGRRRDEYAGASAGDEYAERTRDEDDSGSGLLRFWDEGLITLLIVGGAILFLFPEPATSMLGIVLLGLGVLAWLVDWAT